MTNEWIKNTGKQPVEDDVLVDVMFANGNEFVMCPAQVWRWHLAITNCDITHWRIHNAKPSLTEALQKSIDKDFSDKPIDYFKQPETKPVKILVKKRSAESIVADIFNELSENSLTENDVCRILALYNVVREIKGE